MISQKALQGYLNSIFSMKLEAMRGTPQEAQAPKTDWNWEAIRETIRGRQ